MNVNIEPGHSLGVIGPNGSGKSTLFKILAGVMYPYAGRAETVGRVGALIEISAGIHPELTGRENIFLYGSLLGLPRREVATRFDHIVDFAELGDAIDRQAKFFSSGMRMRLGFAVAAFLEPNVLLVDEALAVGDAAFQQKCLERMREVLAQGTTLLYVSHDLTSVEATCARGMWLDHGTVVEEGDVREVVAAYRRSVEEVVEGRDLPRGPINVMSADVGSGGPIPSHEDVEVTLSVESDASRRAILHIGMSEGTAAPIFSVSRELHFVQGSTKITCALHDLPLPRGRYVLWVAVTNRMRHHLQSWHPTTTFDVTGPGLDPVPAAVARLSPVHVKATWSEGADEEPSS
ncbi:MAG TPA: ATP-binding cassette domain-containing protein [Actinomycetota bacterium]|nr:ATP-binding cassette domain-containing protein [Actinomycetota bacterium]